MLLLNIGCGNTFHPAWVNLDIHPSTPQVQEWNISKGIPFGPEQVDVCYTSHLLEHLSRREAERFLRECHRVLKQGGHLRVAVPDLEGIAKAYVTLLDEVCNGNREALPNLEWIRLELLDQLVREQSGGGMREYLSNPSLQNREFILSRIGMEGAGLMSSNGRPERERGHGGEWDPVESARNGLRHLAAAAHRPRVAGRRLRVALTRVCCRLLLGEIGEKGFDEGLFRQAGELHRWMYDRLSLRQLIEQSGFVEVMQCTAFQSRIREFDAYGLDVVDGQIRKPDSLFLEATKRSCV